LWGIAHFHLLVAVSRYPWMAMGLPNTRQRLISDERGEITRCKFVESHVQVARLAKLTAKIIEKDREKIGA
jgi:hypothetical protein